MANSIGVIDNGYCGDDDIWRFPALAFRDTLIPVGARICQFQLAKQAEPVEFEKVDRLGNKNRGSFGSSGWDGKVAEEHDKTDTKGEQ